MPGDDGTIKLGYDGKKVEAGFASLENRAKSSAAGIGNTYKSLASRVGASMKVIGASGVAFGAIGARMFKGALSDMDDLADASIRLNETPETLQRVGAAAKLSGSSVETLADAMLKLERGLGDADNAKAREALARYGFTAEEIIAMPLDEKIVALASAYTKARTEGHGLADIQALMGKQSAELIPLLAMTGDELRGMYAGVNVLSNQAVEDMARLNDQVDLLAINWSTQLKKMAVGAAYLAEETVALTKDLLDGGGTANRDALTERRVQDEESGLKRRAEAEKRRASQAANIAAEVGKKADAKAAESAKPRAALEDRASSGEGGERQRKRIRGYSGAQRARNPFLDQRGFNEFFYQEETQFGQRSAKPLLSQSFDEVFHRRAARNQTAEARANRISFSRGGAEVSSPARIADKAAPVSGGRAEELLARMEGHLARITSE